MVPAGSEGLLKWTPNQSRKFALSTKAKRLPSMGLNWINGKAVHKRAGLDNFSEGKSRGRRQNGAKAVKMAEFIRLPKL